MTRPRIALVMGTRPEAIKMAPVVKALKERADEFATLVLATAQHRQMFDQVLSLFEITPDVDLDLMQPDQDLTDLTCRVLKMMKATLADLKPDLVLVQGDTTTVFATSLAAFYLKVPVGHVEAGLGSHDLLNPFLEELNRHLTAMVTAIHLPPTPLARRELLHEGVLPEKIAVTGNTVVDCLVSLLDRPWSLKESPLAGIPLAGHRLLLVTSHRRESWGPDLENICLALKDLVFQFPDILVVYPVHLNPKVWQTVYALLSGVERIHLLPPLDYLSFINLMRRSHLILTDSGGVIEEAPSLHKPLLIMRQVTERPEAVQAGLARIVGTAREGVVKEATLLLTDQKAYRAMTTGNNPYGDGRAAERIVEVLCRWFRHQSLLLDPEKEFRSAG